MIKLTGTALEKLVVQMAGYYKRDGSAHISRAGVQAVRNKDEWVVIPSLPDFEGVFAPRGNQIIFDCKVCSQASFDLSKYRSDTKGSRSRQLRHMLERSQFGSVCFFLIHWNPRSGKTFHQPAETFAFPVHAGMLFWQCFERGEVRSLTREDSKEYGWPVKWGTVSGGRTLRPLFLEAIPDIA